MSGAQAALVTGGVRRLGRAVVLAMADMGYDIALHVHRGVEDAEETAAQVRALGKNCQLIHGDLTQTEDIKQLMPQAVAHFPALNVLVNGASIFEKNSFASTGDDLLQANIALHITAPFLLSQAFAKHVEQQSFKGNIINITDSYVTRNTPAYFAYLLTKKSLQDFTQMSALVLGPEIRVNALAPGLVLPSDHYDEAAIAGKTQGFPLARKPSLPEIQQAVQMILREEYLTGQSIFVDSGQHLV